MSRSIELSDALVADARLVAELTGQTIAGQIEFWAGLGRAVERVLGIENVLALQRRGGSRSIEECLSDVDTPHGRARLREVLNSGPFPHYEGVPGHPELLLRIEESGTRTVGRFINRECVKVEVS